MADLDEGIEAFFTTLDQSQAGDRALVMTVSEFGAPSDENGSGTDHGTAAPHFFIGPGVKGGRYGETPSLTALDEHRTSCTPSTSARCTRPRCKAGSASTPHAILGKGFAPLPLLA